MSETAPSTTPAQALDSDAAIRSRLYALFAEAFTYPAGDLAMRLLGGEVVGEIEDGMSALELPAAADQQAGRSHDLAVHELQLNFTRLFDVTGGKPSVSLLQRRYGDVAEQKLWEDLLAFYTHFGLDFANGQAAEQPDHLQTQLGFMHYLSFLEAGSASNAADLKRGQRDFLSLHLVGWVPAMAERLSQSPYYGELATLLVGFIQADLDFLMHAIGDDTSDEPPGTTSSR